MATFLCFRLHGPMASWGDIAVAGRRPGSPNPSRSAVLGLVAAALGIRRDDGDRLADLDRCVGFASRTDAAGELLTDYHTAQGPDETLLRAAARSAKKAGEPWHRPATRRAELAFPRSKLATILSSRQYRVDALWTVALWLQPRETSIWTLGDLTSALRQPQFPPYLGRKSCPLDLPMEPQTIEATNPGSAMVRAVFHTDDLLAPLLERRSTPATLQWEGLWPDLVPEQTVRRRDRVMSRARWQFTEREEHQMQWATEAGGGHVPEQS